MRFLFLDDERMPGDVTWISIDDPYRAGTHWEIVRSYNQAVAWVKANGFPDVISFDHDLGVDHYMGDYNNGQTGYDFAKWLVDYDMDTNSMPENFSFTVHSMNPTGAKNIQCFLDSYISFKKDK